MCMNTGDHSNSTDILKDFYIKNLSHEATQPHGRHFKWIQNPRQWPQFPSKLLPAGWPPTHHYRWTRMPEFFCIESFWAVHLQGLAGSIIYIIIYRPTAPAFSSLFSNETSLSKISFVVSHSVGCSPHLGGTRLCCREFGNPCSVG